MQGIPYISNSKTVFALIHTTTIENYDDGEYTIMNGYSKNRGCSYLEDTLSQKLAVVKTHSLEN